MEVLVFFVVALLSLAFIAFLGSTLTMMLQDVKAEFREGSSRDWVMILLLLSGIILSSATILLTCGFVVFLIAG